MRADIFLLSTLATSVVAQNFGQLATYARVLAASEKAYKSLEVINGLVTRSYNAKPDVTYLIHFWEYVVGLRIVEADLQQLHNILEGIPFPSSTSLSTSLSSTMVSSSTSSSFSTSTTKPSMSSSSSSSSSSSTLLPPITANTSSSAVPTISPSQTPPNSLNFTVPVGPSGTSPVITLPTQEPIPITGTGSSVMLPTQEPVPTFATGTGSKIPGVNATNALEMRFRARRSPAPTDGHSSTSFPFGDEGSPFGDGFPFGGSSPFGQPGHGDGNGNGQGQGGNNGGIGLPDLPSRICDSYTAFLKEDKDFLSMIAKGNSRSGTVNTMKNAPAGSVAALKDLLASYIDITKQDSALMQKLLPKCAGKIADGQEAVNAVSGQAGGTLP